MLDYLRSRIEDLAEQSRRVMDKIPVPAATETREPHIISGGLCSISLKLCGLHPKSPSASLQTMDFTTTQPRLWLKWMLWTSHLFLEAEKVPFPKDKKNIVLAKTTDADSGVCVERLHAV